MSNETIFALGMAAGILSVWAFHLLDKGLNKLALRNARRKLQKRNEYIERIQEEARRAIEHHVIKKGIQEAEDHANWGNEEE